MALLLKWQHFGGAFATAEIVHCLKTNSSVHAHMVYLCGFECVYRHTSSSVVPQNGPRARNQKYIKYVDVHVYWHMHMCPKTVPPPCFDCVKDACKISVNGHVQVGFDYSKDVSRSFLYGWKGTDVFFFVGSHPPRTPQTLSTGQVPDIRTDVRTYRKCRKPR